MTGLVRVKRYGGTIQTKDGCTWENPKTDPIRREECLCLSCDRLKPNTIENCPAAEIYFSACKLVDGAVCVTRCNQFVPKDDLVVALEESQRPYAPAGGASVGGP